MKKKMESWQNSECRFHSKTFEIDKLIIFPRNEYDTDVDDDKFVANICFLH